MRVKKVFSARRRETVITPALQQPRSEGILVDGPIAPEVIFRVAAKENKWDVILACITIRR